MKDILFDRLQFGDLARHLLLTGGDPVDALPYRVEVERNCVKLLLVGRGGGWCGRRARVGSVPRNWGGLRYRPAKPWERTRDHLSGRAAVGLPSRGSGYTDAKRDQCEGERGSLAEPRPLALDLVIFQVGWVDSKHLD